MNIIFDLDGTLIDSSDRMYCLFTKLVDDRFSKNEYWDLKRNKMNHKMILEKFYPTLCFEDFEKTWLSMIELSEYLNLDRLYQDTKDTLCELFTGNKLILFTARQNKKNLYDELERLCIKSFFSEILVTEARLSKKEMFDMYKDSLLNARSSIYISDVGSDILIGKEYNILTVGITHGFTNRSKLSEYAPDYITDSLKDVVKIVEEIKCRKN